MKTTDWITLSLAALVAVGASALTGALTSRRAVAAPTELDSEVARLSEELARLAEERSALARALDGRTPAADAAADSGARRATFPNPEALDLAVARWMAEHAPAELVVAASDGNLGGTELELLVERVLADEDTDMEFWQELRESGRIDDVVARLEELVEAAPGDPDVRVAMGDAYLHQSFGVGIGPAQIRLAEKAVDAYDDALALDGRSWDARWGKAMTLSNSPAFLGKSVEARHEFERLVELQEGLPPEERFAPTYLLLGNLYQEDGETERARAIWSRGLELHPEFGDLRERMRDAAGGGR